MNNSYQLTRQVCIEIFIGVIFCNARLFAQTNSGDTNAPLKLLPPYSELPPTFWEHYATAISCAGIGLVALIAIALWHFFRPKPKITILPGVQAREALLKLREQPESGALLSHVSQVVRNYFIAAFQLTPAELTTTEFSRELSRCEKIKPGLSDAATEFLRECDAHKFSGTAGSATLDAANRALNLVEQAELRRAQLRQPAETNTQSPSA